MEVRTEKDLYGSCLYFEIQQWSEERSYAYKMLEKNKIKGVLKGKERVQDGKSYFVINCSGKEKLSDQFKEKEITLEEIKNLFVQLTEIAEGMKEYMLEETMIFLNPEYIFFEREEKLYYLTVLPWENKEEYPWRNLAEFLLEKAEQKDPRCVNVSYRFYREQRSREFSLSDFIKTIEPEEKKREEEENVSDEMIIERREKEEVIREDKENKKDYLEMICIGTGVLLIGVIFLPMVNSIQKAGCMILGLLLFSCGIGKKLIAKKKNNKQTKEIEEEEIISGMEETIFFFSDEQTEELSLRWKEKGRKKEVKLEMFPFTIGKKKEQVSLCLKEPSVSRIHCRIIEQDGRPAIMDMESTNGTYLNGIRLKKGEIMEIVKNDEILIGKVRVLVV